MNDRRTTRLRTTIAKRLPQAIVPYGRRAMRHWDQITGYPSSGKRPGVVLMLHIGRCGSTVLANQLDQNPKIYWDAKLHRKAHNLYRDAKSLDYAVWTKRQFLISGDKYYGFEFKILQDQYPAILGTTTKQFLEQCKLIGITHYILLKRRNTLRHIVSHYASINRQKWHISNIDNVKPKRFTIDINNISTGSASGRSLVEYLQEVDNTHNETKEILNDQMILEIEYESDIDKNGPEFAYKKICEYLGIELADVEVENIKANPFPMRTTVQNYDEIAQKLKGTNFEWMLEGEC